MSALRRQIVGNMLPAVLQSMRQSSKQNVSAPSADHSGRALRRAGGLLF